MRIFKNFFERINVWKWLTFTILPSLLPMFVSIMNGLFGSSLSHVLGDYVKMSDVIFMGICMSMSNMNIWRMRAAVTVKDKITFWSTVSLVVFSIALVHDHLDRSVPMPAGVLLFVLLIVNTRLSMEISTRRNTSTKRR